MGIPASRPSPTMSVIQNWSSFWLRMAFSSAVLLGSTRRLGILTTLTTSKGKLVKRKTILKSAKSFADAIEKRMIQIPGMTKNIAKSTPDLISRKITTAGKKLQLPVTLPLGRVMKLGKIMRNSPIPIKTRPIRKCFSIFLPPGLANDSHDKNQDTGEED